MANDKNKVIAGRPAPAGGLSLGPVGTALPTDETTALNVALVGAGYLHKDGVSVKPTRESTDEQAWGGDTVLVVQTKSGFVVSFTLIETLGGQANRIAFGTANTTITPATALAGTKVTVLLNGLELDHWTAVIDLRNGPKKVRFAFPDAAVTTVDEITFKDDASVGYKITLSLLPDAAGNYGYRYSDDGVTTV